MFRRMFIALTLVVLLSLTVSAKILYVPDNYTTIQSAVNHAVSGDTIVVRDGVYDENVVIAKSNVTLESENGSAKCTIRARNPFKNCITIEAGGVKVVGFTITGSSHYSAGISVDGADLCVIEGCKIVNNDYGIYIHNGSNRNDILNNTFEDNWRTVLVRDSSYNKIINNKIYIKFSYQTFDSNVSSTSLNAFPVLLPLFQGIILSNADRTIVMGNLINAYGNASGIHVSHSDECVISNNTVKNGRFGIVVVQGDEDRVVSNSLIGNRYGVYLYLSENDTIYGNVVESNYYYGIYLQESDYNRVRSNTITGTVWNALGLWGSKGNIVKSNIVHDNDNNGIYLFLSSNNTISNNTCYANGWGGIYLWYSTMNKIFSNVMKDNGFSGLALWSSNGNVVVGNVMTENAVGLYIYDSDREILKNNTITNNTINVIRK